MSASVTSSAGRRLPHAALVPAAVLRHGTRQRTPAPRETRMRARSRSGREASSTRPAAGDLAGSKQWQDRDG